MNEGKPMDTDSRVQLAEIRGDIKLILEGQKRSLSDFRDLVDRVHSHSNRFGIVDARFGVIESKLTMQDGLRQGIATSLKVAYSVMGLLGGGSLIGIVAFIFRLKGV